MSKKGEAGGCRFDIGVGDIGGVDPVCGVGDVDVDGAPIRVDDAVCKLMVSTQRG